MDPKFSLIIRWSHEDQCFIAWVPEFGPGAKVHGDTYESAAKAGREVIESIHSIPAADRPILTTPWLYESPQEDSRIGRKMFPDSEAYQPERKSPVVV